MSKPQKLTPNPTKPDTGLPKTGRIISALLGFGIIKAIVKPFLRVIFDIFRNSPIIVFITDNVVVERFLPNPKPRKFCNNSFKLSDNRIYRRRGGYYPPVLLTTNPPVVVVIIILRMSFVFVVLRADNIRPQNIAKKIILCGKGGATCSFCLRRYYFSA